MAIRTYLPIYNNRSNNPNAWAMNIAASIRAIAAVNHLYLRTWKKKYGEKKLVRGRSGASQPRFLSRSSACPSTLTNSNPTPVTRNSKPMNSIANWSPFINLTHTTKPTTPVSSGTNSNQNCTDFPVKPRSSRRLLHRPC